jgi:hypothetical protein
LRNPTASRVAIRLSEVRAPSLVLQVETEDGAPVRLAPPPLPQPGGEEEGINADGEELVIYRGLFDRTLPPGAYRVRYVGRSPLAGGDPDEPLLSNWVDFLISAVPAGAVATCAPRPSCLEWLIEWLIRIWRKLWGLDCREIYGGCVDQSRTETIEIGRRVDCDGGLYGQSLCASRTGEYEWYARFGLRISELTCKAVLDVRISYEVAPEAYGQPYLADIRKMLEDAWHEKFRLCVEDDGGCCLDGFPIQLRIDFVKGFSWTAHHHVVFSNHTTHIGQWAYGGADAVHEFGHMLGPSDEYCTVDKVAWCAPHHGDTIMNSAAKPAVDRHLDWLRDEASVRMGRPCLIVPFGASCSGL